MDESKMPTGPNREVELFPGDWDGFMGIGKEKLNSNDKQLIGGVDEFYLFPCELSASNVKIIKDSCSRFGKKISKIMFIDLFVNKPINLLDLVPFTRTCIYFFMFWPC